MPKQRAHKLLVNRTTLQHLRQGGPSAPRPVFDDLAAARRFALWSGHSATDLYLLALMSTATRQVTRKVFARQALLPGLRALRVGDHSRPLPGLKGLYRSFPTCYPSAGGQAAGETGMARQQILARRRLLAETYLLEALLANPAAQVLRPLFDDSDFRRSCDYHVLVSSLDDFLRVTTGAEAPPVSLRALLQAPARSAPHSLAAQAAYIVEHWAAWLPAPLVAELTLARAVSIEESRPRLAGPGPTPMPRFGRDAESQAPAAFTEDTDWMTRAVLLAKSVQVWLDQLGRQYQRAITTLAEIPEQELERLAAQGFNALWLIGIWERSRASRTIKQLCGNPEAEASAYALHAYRVAADLGGEEALNHLEKRCRDYGIRLACDVVPNHTGIDSEWVLQHPEWFLQADHPPYPSYRFSGPDLCDVAGVSIRIEDGYWDHSDAAVVCELHDHASGRRRYIYHGNDGTHMPWNDTAQLNFLLPEVRQAMSDLILAVARRFSMIRFDAAMTLARKHYRRLWFPPPGGGAGVPSRSTFCLTDQAFNDAFPAEFWREVVDRINREAPDTLLVAEAFWLMESYFVRNLGMHRVYNSAFMNMLKREENAKYRQILKDILAYNPGILKRYVNFMNNPDEATAVEQFGKGDKYFGVATLLATLPGLPMFGHGQIEGYREKYGMEYRRAYWGEVADSGFMEHHQRRIFPLLRRRRDYAGVEHFLLYDYATPEGVNENVYAFSNGAPGHSSLVLFNNSAEETTGRVLYAHPKAPSDEEGAGRPMPPLWQALGLDPAPGTFCRYRELSGAEYLLPAEQLAAGFPCRLNGYQHHVFSDFRMLDDHDGTWRALYERTGGGPVDDLHREQLRLAHEPLWKRFADWLEPQRLHVLSGGLAASPRTAPVKTLFDELVAEREALLLDLRKTTGLPAAERGEDRLQRAMACLPGWLKHWSRAELPLGLLSQMWHGDRIRHGLGGALLGWLLLSDLGQRLGLTGDRHCLDLLRQLGLDHAWQEATALAAHRSEPVLVLQLLSLDAQGPHPAIEATAFNALCRAPHLAGWLGINQDDGVDWFHEESMTALAGAVALQAAIMAGLTARDQDSEIQALAEVLRRRLARAAACGYQLDKFLQLG